MTHPSVRSGERGYAMAALLVAMNLIAIALSVALPVYQTVGRREREAELVFRGEQYARAIGMFQRKYGNSLPPDVDVLVKEKFLRKKYKDPITGDDFRFLGPGSPELAQALSTTPQQALDAQRGGAFGNRGAIGRGAAPQGMQGMQGRSAQSPFSGRGAQPQTSGRSSFGRSGGQGMAAAGAEAGSGAGIVAVSSKSSQTSFRVYNGKNKYNEWIFMALSATTAAGAPAGAGGQAPGGRGGVAPGGRGAPAPAGPRGGRRGISPFGAR